jgi:hypothetical protein
MCCNSSSVRKLWELIALYPYIISVWITDRGCKKAYCLFRSQPLQNAMIWIMYRRFGEHLTPGGPDLSNRGDPHLLVWNRDGKFC